MRLIDHVYADTLRKIIANVLHQIKDCESFVADKNEDDDEFKQSVRDEIPGRVKLVTPAIINLYHAFKLFVDDEVTDFVEKYKIVIPPEGEKTVRETYASIFDEWVGEAKLVSEAELEISQDFCTFLDSHFDEELKELLNEIEGEPFDYKDYIHNMSACMLSILDYLKLQDNCKTGDEDMLDLNDETLSEMMFRKMKGYNIDLNKELNFTHLEPVIVKKEKISSKERNALDTIIEGLSDVEVGSGEKQEYLSELKSLREKL